MKKRIFAESAATILLLAACAVAGGCTIKNSDDSSDAGETNAGGQSNAGGQGIGGQDNTGGVENIGGQDNTGGVENIGGQENVGGQDSTGGEGGISEEAQRVETIRLAIMDAINADSRTASKTPLTVGEYREIKEAIAEVPGVEGVEYIDDVLGTFWIFIEDSGAMTWQHIKNDFLEYQLLPDTSALTEMNQEGWGEPDVYDDTWMDLPSSNNFATQFPVAQGNPDPEFTSDEVVSCKEEGSIAVIDFTWTEGTQDPEWDYLGGYDAGGKLLWDRLEAMAKAANFKFTRYNDDAVNLKNFKSILTQHTYVIFNGHGKRPSFGTSTRAGMNVSIMSTPEKWSPAKAKEDTGLGMTYMQAFKDGLITTNADDTKIGWTSKLIADYYVPPTDPQVFIFGQCWGMLPYNIGVYWNESFTEYYYYPTDGEVKNFGWAARQAGVEVVIGSYTPVQNNYFMSFLLKYFRRQLGGYFSGDPPPYPHVYWPTCMSAQTPMRCDQTPAEPKYCNKIYMHTIFTMQAQENDLFTRQTCTTPNAHWALQSFMLQAGTPANTINQCWNEYWAGGVYPSPLEVSHCGEGDNPTTQEASANASCAVKQARAVTNEMLRVP